MMHRRTNAAAYTDSAEMETPYVGVYAFIRSMSTTTPYGNCIIVSRKLSRLHTNTHNVICMYIIHSAQGQWLPLNVVDLLLLKATVTEKNSTYLKYLCTIMSQNTLSLLLFE